MIQLMPPCLFLHLGIDKDIHSFLPFTLSCSSCAVVSGWVFTTSYLPRLQKRRLTSIESHFRDGNYEAAAPLPDKLQLLHDFVFQVPGKDDYVVRLRFANTVGVVDRYAGTRQVSPLLVQAAIHRVFDQVPADAAVMQERGALSRRPVAGNLLALLRGREKKINKLEFGPSHLPREAFVPFDPVEFRGNFIVN